jgi:hypothetical protein
MTNLKPFNLEDALTGKPCVTRDGRKVKNIHLIENANHPFPLVACIENDNTDTIGLLRKDGTDLSPSNGNDLFMTTIKKKLWMGVEKNPIVIDKKFFTTYAYDSKEMLLEMMISQNVNQNDYHIIEIEIEE